MAMSKSQSVITWSAAAFIDVTAGAIVESDVITFPVDMWSWSLSVRADNQGTPATGDIVDVYLSFTNGDIDADGSAIDDYDTQQAANLRRIGILDTFSNGLSGAAPAGGIVQLTKPELPLGAKAAKLIIDSSAASTIRIYAGMSQALTGA